MVKLGDFIHDPITGFNGQVTAKCEYLTGKPRVMCEAIDSTGRPVEWWFDEKRVEINES